MYTAQRCLYDDTCELSRYIMNVRIEFIKVYCNTLVFYNIDIIIYIYKEVLRCVLILSEGWGIYLLALRVCLVTHKGKLEL